METSLIHIAFIVVGSLSLLFAVCYFVAIMSANHCWDRLSDTAFLAELRQLKQRITALESQVSIQEANDFSPEELEWFEQGEKYNQVESIVLEPEKDKKLEELDDWLDQPIEVKEEVSKEESELVDLDAWQEAANDFDIDVVEPEEEKAEEIKEETASGNMPSQLPQQSKKQKRRRRRNRKNKQKANHIHISEKGVRISAN